MKIHIGRAGAYGIVFGALAGASGWSCGSGGGATPGTTGTENSQSTSGNQSTSSSAIGSAATTNTGGTTPPGESSSSSSEGTTSGTGGPSPSTSSTGLSSSTPSGGQSGSTSSTTGTSSAAGSATVAFDAAQVAVTGVRGIGPAPAQSIINLHNGGSTAVTVTKLAFSGTISLAANKTGGGATYSMQTPTNQELFQATTTLPATIMPNADLPITVQMTTTGATLPADPPGPAPYDSGSNLFTDTLTATLSTGSATATVYGLLLVQNPAAITPPPGAATFVGGYESTLGQILTTTGYQVNVGAAQTDWNPNTAMVATMLSMSNPAAPGEITTAGGNLFVKAGAGMVTMTVLARFSPQGSLGFGWYTPGGATPMTTTVGTMQLASDTQTSDLARMVYPPLMGTTSTGAAGSTASFDPGSGSFGIWVYSDQLTQKFNEGGTKTNGDYDYSEDSLNSPANVHRVKTFPLADASGTAIPQSYLIAIEEASNGDYQDYVFVISNVSIAP